MHAPLVDDNNNNNNNIINYSPNTPFVFSFLIYLVIISVS